MAKPSRRSVVASSLGCTALVAVLVVGLGCSSRGEGGAESAPRGPSVLRSCDGPPPGERVDITFVHPEADVPNGTGGRADRIEGYVADFEVEHPNIHVEVVPYRDGADALLTSWRRRTADERPDLALLPQQANGLLIDSAQTVAPGGCTREVAPDMLRSIAAQWSARGVLQAVPFAVSTPVLVYDRNLFLDAGIDPDVRLETFDDVQLDALKIVRRRPSVAGFAFDTGPESGASWLVEQLPARAGAAALDHGNGRHGTPASVTWRDGLAVEQVDQLAQMIEGHLAVSVGRNTSRIDAMITGADPDQRAGMAFRTCGALGPIFDALDARDALDDGAPPAVDLGVAPLPRPNEGAFQEDQEVGHVTAPGGAALWLAAGKSEAETAAAWELARYLASPDVQADWAAATGLVPISATAAAHPVLEARWTEHPEMKVAYDVLAAQKIAPTDLGPRAGPLPEIHELQAEALETVVTGHDPADALAVAAEDADRLLRAYADSRPDPP